MMQILVPAVRVATQTLGIVAGRMEGMLIIQTTQLITVFGGPSGYMYVAPCSCGAGCSTPVDLLTY